MHYVYVLQSKKDDNLYTGCTQDLKKRIVLHNSGKVSATKKRLPVKLIFYEAFVNRDDAFKRERYLKSGWGRRQLNQILNNYLNN